MTTDISNARLSVNGVQLVTIPDWGLEEGKLYGLCGETGSGKSTIGKWLGNVEPIYWDVRFDGGESDENFPSYQQEHEAGNHSCSTALYLLQDAYQIFNPYISIFRHFKDIWKNNSSATELDSFDAIYEILSNLGIVDPGRMIHRKIHQVSQGEAQRMAFVLSFIRPASLRIYDEVFSNVDEESSRKMMTFLQEFCRQTGDTAVIISHDTGILKEYVDTTYLIRDGVLEEVDFEMSQITSPDAHQVFPLLMIIRDLVVPGYDSRSGQDGSLCSLPELVIGQGENVGLNGASGLGKTTLLKGLLGEYDLRWTACTVHCVENPDESQLSDLDIRYLPQSVVSAFNPARTIGVSIAEIQDIRRVSDQEKLRFLSHFGLPTDYLRKYPNELSGGEIQRMGIISVLMGEPDLILLDESFSSVDRETRESIWSVLMDRQKATGFALLVVSHDVEWLNAKMNKVYKLEGILPQELTT